MEKANSSVATENGLLLSARDLLMLTPISFEVGALVKSGNPNRFQLWNSQ